MHANRWSMQPQLRLHQTANVVHTQSHSYTAECPRMHMVVLTLHDWNMWILYTNNLCAWTIYGYIGHEVLAVEINYKSTVPGMMLNSHVFFKEWMGQKLLVQWSAGILNVGGCRDGREGGVVCGRMWWWWGGVGVDWCWMVSSSLISFCASAIPKHLRNVFQFTYNIISHRVLCA